METKTKHNVFIFIRQMKKVQHLATNKKNAMLEQSRKIETLRKRRKKQTNKTQQFNVNTQFILKEKRAAINKLVFCIYIKANSISAVHVAKQMALHNSFVHKIFSVE